MNIGKEAATSMISVIKGGTEGGEGHAATVVVVVVGAMVVAVEDGERPRDSTDTYVIFLIMLIFGSPSVENMSSWLPLALFALILPHAFCP